jgi:DNA-binding NarL/FixJ family response regulator
MSDRIRIVIVDDDVPTRVGLRTILSSASDMEVVGEATTEPESLVVTARTRPDVVLMDIKLLSGDGFEATRRITTAAGADPPRVLVLTTFDYDEYAFKAMRAGASGFLLKRTPAEDLIASVRSVADGNELPSPTPTSRLIDRMASPSGHGRPTVFTEALTAREAELLQLIVQGFSNSEIADELTVSLDTVKTHLKHIYAKCGAQDRAHAVIAAYESGLVPRPL